MERKNSKGITLIALVITVIVLIILAGISINLALGDEGILKMASYAKERNAIAQAKEKLELVLEEAEVNKYTNSKYNQNEYLDEMIVNKVSGSKVNGDVVITDGYGFSLDRNIPAIVECVGKEKDLIFPKINTSITVSADKKTATLTVTGEEEKDGIKKIEIWQDGFAIQSHSYENAENTKTDSFIIPRNGKYTVKVTSILTSSEIVSITELVPSVIYTPNGSSQWKKEYNIKLTINGDTNELKSIKYQWTNTTVEPAKSTFTNIVENNGIIENTLTGKYYLWTLVEDNNGYTRIEKSDIFYFDNTGPTAQITTEWLEENEQKRLKISVNNIGDEHSGMDNGWVNLYVTPANGTKQEKRVNLTNGEGSIIIDGLDQETLTKIDMSVNDYVGNVTKIERSVGRFFIVKGGVITNGEAFGSLNGATMRPSEGQLITTLVAGGHTGCFSGFKVNVPSGRAKLLCNIVGAYTTTRYGEATMLLINSGGNFSISNPGAIWPARRAENLITAWKGVIGVPRLYATGFAEISGEVFLGLFQCRKC